MFLSLALFFRHRHLSLTLTHSHFCVKQLCIWWGPISQLSQLKSIKEYDTNTYRALAVVFSYGTRGFFFCFLFTSCPARLACRPFFLEVIAFNEYFWIVCQKNNKTYCWMDFASLPTVQVQFSHLTNITKLMPQLSCVLVPSFPQRCHKNKSLLHFRGHYDGRQSVREREWRLVEQGTTFVNLMAKKNAVRRKDFYLFLVSFPPLNSS